MTLELRILTGLHRGAALPIDECELVIGASEDADVVLTDPGIAGRHAVVLLTEGGWCLSAADGKVFDADSNRPHTLIDLSAGDFARLDTVWLTVEEQDAPWKNPPPLPQDLAEDVVDEELIAREEENPDHAQASAAVVHADESGETAVIAPAAKAERGDRRKPRWLYIPLLMVAVFTAATAYGITASSSLPQGGAAEATGKKQWSETALGGEADESHEEDKKEITHKKVDNVRQADKSEKNGDARSTAESVSPEELRKIFRKRLADAYLLPRFDLDLGDDTWNMQATLDDDEAARFERVLASFVKTYKVRFPINANVGSAETMLPFKIQQVISGANASIITKDGVRVYLGEEYRGYKLVAINGDQISFGGKRKVEVVW